jgi:MOSC domain-containing protein YiiM
MGILLAIYVADHAGGPMRSVEDAQLISGQGIVGDRYFAGTGRFSPAVQDPFHEVTLIEIEQITQFNTAYGLTLGPEDLRRNLITEGVDLNALVGSEFNVGSAVLKGLKLCEPCKYLAGMTHKDVLGGLLHRAGLRAGIVQGGLVRARDAVYSARRTTMGSMPSV